LLRSCKHFLRKSALQPSGRFLFPEPLICTFQGRPASRRSGERLIPAFCAAAHAATDHAGWRRCASVDQPNPMQDFMACFTSGTCTGWMACEKTLAGLEQVIQ
jgi:hypothetical protein